MASPSAAAMLSTWERGVTQSAVERGLTLMALAGPETDRNLLGSLNIGARDRRLLKLRESCFGTRMTGLMSCKQCGEELEIELTTTELLALESTQSTDLVAQGDDYEVRLRLPDSHDLLKIADVMPDRAERMLLQACVVSATVGGAGIAPDLLPSALVAAAARRLGDAEPFADLQLTFTCMSCGHRGQAPFDIVPFLWLELDAWAERALREVHVLASAYGWGEREILALSPLRRAQYLRMLQA
jgi:hypothetical protein